MSQLSSTLQIGHIGIKKVLIESAQKIEDQAMIVVGRKEDTTQTYERMKTLVGYGLAAKTPEGVSLPADDLSPEFIRDFYPYVVGKKVRISFDAFDTDQYGIYRKNASEMARTFVQTKNQIVSNLNNLGFTDVTSGMNSETLYSASHTSGLVYGANRPLAVGQVAGLSAVTLDIAFSPLGVEQMIQELRRQKDARGLPMQLTGRILVTVPPELEGLASRVIHSDKIALSNNNDVNFVKSRVTFDVVDYYNSTTAWFARMEDESKHGLFLLQRKGYQVQRLADTDDRMQNWIFWESYIPGWMQWRGTWGTQGA